MAHPMNEEVFLPGFVVDAQRPEPTDALPPATESASSPAVARGSDDNSHALLTPIVHEWAFDGIEKISCLTGQAALDAVAQAGATASISRRSKKNAVWSAEALAALDDKADEGSSKGNERDSVGQSLGWTTQASHPNDETFGIDPNQCNSLSASGTGSRFRARQQQQRGTLGSASTQQFHALTTDAMGGEGSMYLSSPFVQYELSLNNSLGCAVLGRARGIRMHKLFGRKPVVIASNITWFFSLVIIFLCTANAAFLVHIKPLIWTIAAADVVILTQFLSLSNVFVLRRLLRTFEVWFIIVQAVLFVLVFCFLWRFDYRTPFGFIALIAILTLVVSDAQHPLIRKLSLYYGCIGLVTLVYIYVFVYFQLTSDYDGDHTYKLGEFTIDIRIFATDRIISIAIYYFMYVLVLLLRKNVILFLTTPFKATHRRMIRMPPPMVVVASAPSDEHDKTTTETAADAALSSTPVTSDSFPRSSLVERGGALASESKGRVSFASDGNRRSSLQSSSSVRECGKRSLGSVNERRVPAWAATPSDMESLNSFTNPRDALSGHAEGDALAMDNAATPTNNMQSQSLKSPSGGSLSIRPAVHNKHRSSTMLSTESEASPSVVTALTRTVDSADCASLASGSINNSDAMSTVSRGTGLLSVLAGKVKAGSKGRSGRRGHIYYMYSPPLELTFKVHNHTLGHKIMGEAGARRMYHFFRPWPIWGLGAVFWTVGITLVAIAPFNFGFMDSALSYVVFVGATLMQLQLLSRMNYDIARRLVRNFEWWFVMVQAVGALFGCLWMWGWGPRSLILLYGAMGHFYVGLFDAQSAKLKTSARYGLVMGSFAVFLNFVCVYFQLASEYKQPSILSMGSFHLDVRLFTCDRFLLLIVYYIKYTSAAFKDRDSVILLSAPLTLSRTPYSTADNDDSARPSNNDNNNNNTDAELERNGMSTATTRQSLVHHVPEEPGEADHSSAPSAAAARRTSRGRLSAVESDGEDTLRHGSIHANAHAHAHAHESGNGGDARDDAAADVRPEGRRMSRLGSIASLILNVTVGALGGPMHGVYAGVGGPLRGATTLPLPGDEQEYVDEGDIGYDGAFGGAHCDGDERHCNEGCAASTVSAEEEYNLEEFASDDEENSRCAGDEAHAHPSNVDAGAVGQIEVDIRDDTDASGADPS